MARSLFETECIDTQFLFRTESATGAAAIIVDAAKGENAIIVVPGACFELTAAEVDQARTLIAASSIFVAQLETLAARRRARTGAGTWAGGSNHPQSRARPAFA